MRFDRSRRGFLALAPPTLALAGCSPVVLFDAVIPHDAARSAAKNVAYGPDPRQRLDIYLPPQPRPGMPVVIFYYGGSWNSGSKDGYSFVGDALAAQGFVTIIPDYRLVPQVRFQGFLDDCASAAAWVQAHIGEYGGDPQRIALAGHSAGAYNAMMLALDKRYLRAAGFERARLKAVVGLAGPYDFLPLDGADVVNAFGAAPDPRQTQPITFVASDAPPMFLAAGDRDTTVEPRSTKVLAARLRKLGVPVDEKIYPGESHAGLVVAIAQPFRDKTPVLADMSAFLWARLQPSVAVQRR